MRMKLLEFLMCCAPCSISQILICQPYYVILHRTDGRVTTMRLLDHFSTSLQTNYFFESASFRIVLSSDSSATRCFRQVFYFSSSFSFFVGILSNPPYSSRSRGLDQFLGAAKPYTRRNKSRSVQLFSNVDGIYFHASTQQSKRVAQP